MLVALISEISFWHPISGAKLHDKNRNCAVQYKPII